MDESAREFIDEGGVRWIVRAVRNPSMPPSLKKLLGVDRRAEGWLVFTSSAGERRRLSPYPDDWASVSDFEIIRWCARASRVPPAPARRDLDSDK